ncbi:MAG TPA: hypothetical protein DEP18_07690 [Flavobacteriales bacterium]|nr:hypothetical protein [Flavobacteriales bacterium]HRE74689.1 T9SS type A sorting domain-containing protein [Flavobacteriales bacterium]HRJ38008.1 T9SS type A sorting domain-containing protein [Flavobacteriales bacterium]
MIKHLLCFSSALIFLVAPVSAQTTLFSENFNSGGPGGFTLNTSDQSSIAAGVYNSWVVNSAYAGGSGSFVCFGFPLPFSVPATPNQPGGITGSPNSGYMHINSVAAASSGIHCASFMAADGLCSFSENYFTRMSSDISTIGQSTVTLNFWWLCAGGAQSYGEVYYSTNGGSSWTLVTTPISQYFGQSAWTQQTISIPAFANQSTLRFGFRFVNATTSSAADPAFALDDIVITGSGTACTPTFSSTVHTACSSYVWNGNTYTASGNYTFLTTNAGGCDSTATLNLTINNPSTSTTAQTACVSYLWNGNTYTTSGTYTYVTTNSQGCDSTATLNLTINNANTNVSQVGNTLTANATGASFQWVDCNNSNQPVPGATAQSFSPITNGSYAVQVTQNGCTDLSACFNVTTIGLDKTSFARSIDYFPNPTTGELNIRFNAAAENISIRILNVVGQVVSTSTVNGSNLTTVFINGEPGLYFIECSLPSGQKASFRVVKQ